MREPFREALQLRRNLLAEQRSLSNLVIETAQVIGRVARHSYAEVNKQPAQLGYPSIIGDWGWYPSPRYFKPYRILRPVDTPITGVPDNDAYGIIKVSTEARKRAHYYRIGRAVSLPVTEKWTAVKLFNPNANPNTAEASATFIIGTGESEPFAYRRSHSQETHTSKTIGNPRDRLWHPDDADRYYSGVEELRYDFTRAYSGALAVTGLVAASLEATYGIENDTTSVPPLLKAWQEVRTSEYDTVSPALLQFLPHDLAVQAGASS